MARITHPEVESAAPIQPLDPEAFRKALKSWYRRHARDLPWRGIRNPYGTWLSEIMLQQTRVATVIERYGEFLRRFPTIAALAAAPEDDVLALWSGLGYYRRARMLHRGAQFVDRELGGKLPRNAADLRTLPGVGEYTAAAIASIAFGESIPVLDGNVERVLLRLLGQPEDKTASSRFVLMKTAEALVPLSAKRLGHGNPPGDHNQAMMELGATICLPRGPLCLQCPVFAFCQTRGEHPTATRQPLRSRRVACLLATRKCGTRTEVLLERRSPEATLMPGMLELPPLPLDAITGREPILRLRHSITNTNFYVEVFAEGAPGMASVEGSGEAGTSEDSTWAQETSTMPSPATPKLLFPGELALGHDERLVTDAGTETHTTDGLRTHIPAAETDLAWTAIRRLHDLPLTGLARKVLQRLGLMSMQTVRIGEDLLV